MTKAPPPAPEYYYRDYSQGRLYKTLTFGRSYCVKFFVNFSLISKYSNNKIGAYLDDGSIDTVSICSKPIIFVKPQVYTNEVIDDTLNWIKIEGSFTANGTERFITLGNFFSLDSVINILRPSGIFQYSYYFIDDVSVIESDLPADAGADTWVEMGKQVQIGRVGDTTAIGLDCKWYHKGIPIDSGAIISVKANSIKYAVDTYVVVQTICGLVKTDTVLVRTVGAGMSTFATTANTFSISPNPSSGKFIISDASLQGKQSEQLSIKVYDLLGRVVYEQSLILNKAQTPLELNLAKGTYILELRTEDAVQRERIVLQ